MKITHLFLIIIWISYLCPGSFGFQYSDPPTQRRGSNDNNNELWGYSTPRTGVHMFWWLYLTTNPAGHANRPLVIWLQGGPSLSGTGLGNFLEIGPLDHNLNPREATWLQEASLLFIDYPVGTGFSYYEKEEQIPTNITAIAEDLYLVIAELLNPPFLKVPIYIVGQSYGGKSAVALARHIQMGQDQRLEGINIAGVVLLSSYVSPPDTIIHYAPLLLNLGFIDENFSGILQTDAKAIYDMLRKDDTLKAYELVGKLHTRIAETLPELDVYNFVSLKKTTVNQAKLSLEETEDYGNLVRFGMLDVNITGLMNGPIKDKLKIIPEGLDWDGEAWEVYLAQSADLHRPETHLVEQLLDGDIHVFVVQGNLDVITNIPGALRWARNLKWRHSPTYLGAGRSPW